MSDDKLWNREYWKVMTSNFMLFFAFYILTPLLPIYLDAQFAADKHMIGIVLSGYVVATLLVRPFSGFIVDTFDRKRVLTLCFFVFFIMFAGYVGAGTLLMFAIVRTLHGLPFGAATVANSTVAIDVLPASRRNEGIGYYGLSNNLAMAIAPSVGIWIYHATGRFDLLFWLALVIALAGFVSSSRVRLPERRRVIGRPKLSLDHFFLGRAWLMAVNICLFGLCWGVMSNYVAIYGQEELGITDGTGLFFMILAVRTDVSGHAQYVHRRCAPRSAWHGQFLDTDFVGCRYGARNTARRISGTVYELCSGIWRHGVSSVGRGVALRGSYLSFFRAAQVVTGGR